MVSSGIVIPDNLYLEETWQDIEIKSTIIFSKTTGMVMIATLRC